MTSAMKQSTAGMPVSILIGSAGVKKQVLHQSLTQGFGVFPNSTPTLDLTSMHWYVLYQLLTQGFSAFNNSTPTKSPTIVSASSLYPSSSNLFAAVLNSASATTSTFGQTSFTTPQAPTSQATKFGQASASSFSNPMAFKPLTPATTGLLGLASPSIEFAEKDAIKSKKKIFASSFAV